jgi:hypothetical protein
MSQVKIIGFVLAVFASVACGQSTQREVPEVPVDIDALRVAERPYFWWWYEEYDSLIANVRGRGELGLAVGYETSSSGDRMDYHLGVRGEEVYMKVELSGTLALLKNGVSGETAEMSEVVLVDRDADSVPDDYTMKLTGDRLESGRLTGEDVSGGGPHWILVSYWNAGISYATNHLFHERESVLPSWAETTPAAVLADTPRYVGSEVLWAGWIMAVVPGDENGPGSSDSTAILFVTTEDGDYTEIGPGEGGSPSLMFVAIYNGKVLDPDLPMYQPMTLRGIITGEFEESDGKKTPLIKCETLVLVDDDSGAPGVRPVPPDIGDISPWPEMATTEMDVITRVTGKALSDSLEESDLGDLRSAMWSYVDRTKRPIPPAHIAMFSKWVEQTYEYNSELGRCLLQSIDTKAPFVSRQLEELAQGMAKSGARQGKLDADMRMVVATGEQRTYEDEFGETWAAPTREDVLASLRQLKVIEANLKEYRAVLAEIAKLSHEKYGRSPN